jgi:hypothetical protein
MIGKLLLSFNLSNKNSYSLVWTQIGNDLYYSNSIMVTKVIGHSVEQAGLWINLPKINPTDNILIQRTSYAHITKAPHHR